MKISYNSKQRVFFCKANTDYQRKSLRDDGFFYNPSSGYFETRYIVKAARLKEYFDDTAKNYIASLSIKNIKQSSRLSKPRGKKADDNEFKINIGDMFFNAEQNATYQAIDVSEKQARFKILEENRVASFLIDTIKLLLKINVLTTKTIGEKTMQPASVTFNLNEMDPESRATVLALLGGGKPATKGSKKTAPPEPEETEDFSSETEETELTLNDVKKACVAFVKKAKDVAKARKMIAKKLSEYGAKETADLDESDYQEFIDSLG